MTLYGIAIHGCDAINEFNMELTAVEMSTVNRLAALSKAASKYDCYPRLTIEVPFEKENE